MAVRRRAVLGGMLAGAAALATSGCIADTYADTTGDHGTKSTTTAKPMQGNQPDRITVVATGDVLLHERLWTTAKRDGKGGNWDFAPLMSGVKPLVQKADLAIAHLETPLAPAGGPYHGYPLFQGPPQIATALKRTGYVSERSDLACRQDRCQDDRPQGAGGEGPWRRSRTGQLPLGHGVLEQAERPAARGRAATAC